MCGKVMIILWNYVGGARLYRSQTARVNAPVQSLIASGPQFLHVWDASPGRVQIRFGPFRSLCRPTVRHAMAKITGQISQRPSPNRATKPFYRIHLDWFDLEEG
jgi:hypothetical protein